MLYLAIGTTRRFLKGGYTDSVYKIQFNYNLVLMSRLNYIAPK